MLTIYTLLCILISCNNQDYDYTIDFRNIPFPDNSLIPTDTLEIKKFITSNLTQHVVIKTDKKEYKFGEKIILTVKNQSEDTLYFFPDVTESARSHYLFSLYSDSIKDAYKNQLISLNPAMAGSLTYNDPSAVYLHFAGVDEFTSKELGLKAFEQPLYPNKEISFSVTLPNRIGLYQFSIRQYFHNIDGYQIWNINNFIVSNEFVIFN